MIRREGDFAERRRGRKEQRVGAVGREFVKMAATEPPVRLKAQRMNNLGHPQQTNYRRNVVLIPRAPKGTAGRRRDNGRAGRQSGSFALRNRSNFDEIAPGNGGRTRSDFRVNVQLVLLSFEAKIKSFSITISPTV